MKVKIPKTTKRIATIALFGLLVLAVAGFGIYYANKPEDLNVEEVVILAGKDLPAEPNALGEASDQKQGDSDSVGTVTLKDEVKSAKDSPVVAQPTPSIVTTSKGDNLLVLINKSIRLPAGYFPKDLVVIDKNIPASAGANQLREDAASALLKLFNDAKKLGYKLNVNSAYRSYETQVATYNYWVSQVGVAQADRFSARPGHSQHQLGTTVDITSDSVEYKLLPGLGNTTEGKWLANNSYKYGFVLSYPAGYEHITGYTYEPWHFRYIGGAAAKKWKDSGMILELYLQKHGVY